MSALDDAKAELRHAVHVERQDDRAKIAELEAEVARLKEHCDAWASQYAEARAAGREDCIRILEGGGFLHSDAPPAKWARDVVRQIRALPSALAQTGEGRP